jgi:chemotaxis response regulator CheB
MTVLKILQALRKALEEHPEWKVCGEASNGIEVVAQSAALNPDVVVLDLTMPRMNGLKPPALSMQLLQTIAAPIYRAHFRDAPRT